MTALERFVLPRDVVIAPVAELPRKIRDQLAHEHGDCAVTRPRTRAQSTVVDADTAALLERFRSPSTIVDAVLAFSAAAGGDPGALLDDAFPVLRGFVADGLLVADGSPLAEPIASSLAAGARVGGFELLEPVHVVSDTEVHLARCGDGGFAAVKLARAGAGGWLHAALAREAAVLRRLDGRATPRLLAAAAHDGRPYLATEWCAGVDVHQAAAEARALGRAELLALLQEVATAYARLHDAGVLHGDVHPRNAIARPDGTVVLIDLGMAAAADGGPAAPRGGVDFFLDPESARARLDGGGPVPLTPAGEQCSVAALLYLLLTGAHTHAFSLEPDAMLRQLAEQPPDPLARHGADDLPAVERVLARALDRAPGARWPSLAAFREALGAAAADDLARADGGTSSRAAGPDPAPGAGSDATARRLGSAGATAARLLAGVLERLAVPGELHGGGLAAPTASAMNGGAGFALALLRIAALRDDPALLARADLWATQATLAAGRDDAFFAAELEIVPEVFGRNSFCHHAAGVHAVQALVAHARGDEPAGTLALQAFVAAAGGPCEHLDVTFGRAGLLLGCSLMLEELPPALDDRALRRTGGAIRDELWAALRGQPPLPDGPPLGALGAAHGWAGYLFALLRWSAASATPPPEGVAERLDQLASLARPAGRGVRWPFDAAGPVVHGGLEASWCNGTAGHVELWALAHRHGGEERFARLAEQAAWTAYESGANVGGDLCCGDAGRAYALLGLHRAGGDDAWLARARMLAERAVQRVAAHALRRDSLYKGEVGVALLVAELDDPAGAGMPLYAAERAQSRMSK